jgi:protein TonB
MALKKTDKADLRSRYPMLTEIGLIASLVLLIVAFRVQYNPDSQFIIQEEQQIVVEMEEIEQTQQIEKPPPPPPPPVPIEVPNDEILEDDIIDIDMEIDIDEPVILPPPPPTEELEPEIFVVVEHMPELVGGIGGLQKRVTYPEIAKKAGVEGTVFLQFIVDEEGNVVDPIVMRGIGAGCDEEALKAIRTAKFTPGKQRGKPVKVKFSLPVRFKLK